MPRYAFSREDCSRGERATASKRLIAWRCPDCGRNYTHVSQLTVSGHRGLHGFANRFTGGNLQRAAEKLALIGQAATDPTPWNGAFQRAHQALNDTRPIQAQDSCP